MFVTIQDIEASIALVLPVDLSAPLGIARAIESIPASTLVRLLAVFGRPKEQTNVEEDGEAASVLDYRTYIALLEAHLSSREVSAVLDEWWGPLPSENEVNSGEDEEEELLSVSPFRSTALRRPRDRLFWLRSGVTGLTPQSARGRWFPGVLHEHSVSMLRAEAAPHISKSSEQQQWGAWSTEASAILTAMGLRSEAMRTLHKEDSLRASFSSSSSSGLGWSLASAISAAEADPGSVDALSALYTYERAIASLPQQGEGVPVSLISELYAGRYTRGHSHVRIQYMHLCVWLECSSDIHFTGYSFISY